MSSIACGSYLSLWANSSITVAIPVSYSTPCFPQNMILGNLLQAFTEKALSLAPRQVYLRSSCWRITENSGEVRSCFVEGALAFNRDFDPKFSVKWLEKDI